jgi:hypothetical protein
MARSAPPVRSPLPSSLRFMNLRPFQTPAPHGRQLCPPFTGGDSAHRSQALRPSLPTRPFVRYVRTNCTQNHTPHTHAIHRLFYTIIHHRGARFQARRWRRQFSCAHALSCSDAAFYCHCEERNGASAYAAIHKTSKMDCFAPLAMTKRSTPEQTPQLSSPAFFENIRWKQRDDTPASRGILFLSAALRCSVFPANLPCWIGGI